MEGEKEGGKEGRGRKGTLVAYQKNEEMKKKRGFKEGMEKK